MRQAYFTLDLADAVLLKDHLVQHGVSASVRNKGAVRVPSMGVASEVWVDDDTDDDALKKLIQSFVSERQDAAAGSVPSWHCRHCGEDSPGNFDVCWSCGREKPSR